MRGLILALCCSFAQLASAQLPSIRLPAGSALPNLPLTQLPLQQQLDAELRGDLTGLRILHARTLLRTHRDVIEADPHGNPIVRGDVLAMAPTPAALQTAAAAGFTVTREYALDDLDTRIVVLHVSSATVRSLERLRAANPDGVYDFNHIYIESGAIDEEQIPVPPVSAGESTPAPFAAKPSGRIGLIDSGVDGSHEVFKGLTLHQHGCAGRPVPDEHGTAVASLMVGRAPDFHGAAAGSELYAADVYCGLPTGGAVDAVAEAFAWLAHEGVPVINVSLVGPANRVLEAIVERLLSRGHIIVAAVGNDGPAAPPLYPAAWPGVVGITAVDEKRRVLFEAERGPQVKFAAPGAQMAAARHPSGYTLVRGTSFAAPIVAGLLSLDLQALDHAAANKAIATLASEAVDLGSPGVDPVYGYGLVGEALRRQPALAALRAEQR